MDMELEVDENNNTTLIRTILPEIQDRRRIDAINPWRQRQEVVNLMREVNYREEHLDEILRHPQVSLLFHWESLPIKIKSAMFDGKTIDGSWKFTKGSGTEYIRVAFNIKHIPLDFRYSNYAEVLTRRSGTLFDASLFSADLSFISGTKSTTIYCIERLSKDTVKQRLAQKKADKAAGKGALEV